MAQTMEKIDRAQVEKLAEQYGLRAVRIGKMVQIAKNPNDALDDISWDEFFGTLGERNLAVFKATKSDFLKIMKV